MKENKIISILVMTIMITTIFMNIPSIKADSPPVILNDPDGPSSGFTGLSYGFTIMARDPDADNGEDDKISYGWIWTWDEDWGYPDVNECDWTEYCTSGLETTTSHTWETPGEYDIVVIPKDSNGNIGTASGYHHIAITTEINHPPNPPTKPNGPTKGTVDESLTFSTIVRDPDNDQIERVGWSWDGDEQVDRWLQGPFNSDSTVYVDHQFNSVGTYYIRACAEDINGELGPFSEQGLTVNIGQSSNNPPNKPTMPSGPNSGDLYDDLTFTTSAVDVDGDNIRFGWDWNNDNVVEDEDWTDFYTSGQTCSYTHSFSSAGTYYIRVKAKDNHGAQSVFSNAKTVEISSNSNNYLTINIDGSGTTNPSAGMHVYDFGETVSIQAFPDNGWSFEKWSGDLSGSQNPISITMDENKQITAHFIKDEIFYNLIIEKEGNGETNPITGSYSYPKDTKVNIHVVEKSGWIFSHWSGDVPGDKYEKFQCIVMDSDKTVKAHFVQDVPLSVNIKESNYYGYTNNGILFGGDFQGGLGPYTWSWEFGDGNSISGEDKPELNPTHIYDESKAYNVKFSVEDRNGNTKTDETNAFIGKSYEKKYAIILIGDAAGSEIHQELMTFSAQKMYNCLTSKYNFKDKNIFVLFNRYTYLAVDESFNTNIVDCQATTSDLQNVINNINDPDLIFFTYIGHGDGGTLYSEPTLILKIDEINYNHDLLTSRELKNMMQGKGGQQIFVLNSCYSGSFIEGLSKENRIICASSSFYEITTQLLYDGGFINCFIDLMNGAYDKNGDGYYTIQEAFEYAEEKTYRDMNLPDDFGQRPVIDDNGDGEGSSPTVDIFGNYAPETPGEDGFYSSGTTLNGGPPISNSPSDRFNHFTFLNHLLTKILSIFPLLQHLLNL